MLRHSLIFALGVTILALTAATAAGDVPRTLSYQGHLLDSEGQPVSGSVPMSFAIYDDSASGTQLWEHIYPGVDVEDGAFSVVLGGADNPIPDSAFSGSQAWLEVVVDGESIDPRTRLTAMPYSFAAKSVKGDFESGPGQLTLSESSGRGGFMQLMSHDAGNSMAMTMIDPTDEGAFGMFNFNGGEPATMVEIRASQNLGASLELWGPTAVFPSDPIVWLGDGGSDGGMIRMADPTDYTDHRALLELRTDPMTGGCLRLFNTQPESATSPAVELDLDALTFLNVECGGKSSWRTIVGKCGIAFDDTTGETLKVAMELDRVPYEAWYMADGLKAGAMVVTDTRVGIGVDNPSENLVIGKDLGGWAGNRLVIGDDTPYVQPGLMVGEDNNNRGWFLWDVDSNYVRIGLKQSGISYTKVLNIFGNGVGIKKTFPDYALDVNGDIQCTGIHQASDGRLKNNIRQLPDALRRIEQINGVAFEWNELAETRGGIVGRRDIGVIADEVERVFPELVYTDSEGYKSVAYTKLVPVLIEAVKDQQATIDQLSSQVAKLTALVQMMTENH